MLSGVQWQDCSSAAPFSLRVEGGKARDTRQGKSLNIARLPVAVTNGRVGREETKLFPKILMMKAPTHYQTPWGLALG